MADIIEISACLKIEAKHDMASSIGARSSPNGLLFCNNNKVQFFWFCQSPRSLSVVSKLKLQIIGSTEISKMRTKHNNYADVGEAEGVC